MAKAITQIEKKIPNQAEEQAQAIHGIMSKVGESQEAITVFLDILNELHHTGILEMVQGVLKNRNQVGLIAMTQLNQPGMYHILKNGMSAIEFLSRLEPAKLEHMLNAVARGVERFADTETNKRTSVWGVGKALLDPDVTLSMTTFMNFLRGMGEELKEQDSVH